MVLGAALLQTAVHGSEVLINLTNQVWRYDQSGVNSPAFREPSFDDSMWPEGRSILAYENSMGVVALNNNVYPYTNTVLLPPPAAPLAPNHTVDFFRTRFTFSGPGNPDTWVLTLSNLVDDGYVAYLNGVEVDRFNMNPNNDMLAAATAPQGEGVYFVRQMCIPPGTLVLGENVLAVRVHQNAGGSADVVWGTVLHAHPGSVPLVLSPPTNINILLREGGNTNLMVTVQASPCTTYQWYKNNQPIAGATSRTFTIANMDASQAGTYFLRSVNAVGITDSPNFIVTYVDDVTPPHIGSASADPWDLSMITVTFSEDVMDVLNTPFDPIAFYIETRLNPGIDFIAAANVQYGSSSNIAIVTLAQPRDPAINYQLVISNHAIEDRFGNRMYDPTIAFVTVPTVFQEGMSGYTGTQDTTLRQSSPTNNSGSNTSVLCDASPLSQGLLRFDNIIDTGRDPILRYISIIHSAKLRLFTVDRSAANTPVRLLRMAAPWDEGSTWDSMAGGIDQTNGVETGATDALAVADVMNGLVEIDVTAAVQAWADGASNYGWAFLATGTDGWAWASSEYFDPFRRPALLVNHSHFDPICRIVQQPQSVTVRAGQPFYLGVGSIGSDLTYEWFRNGAPISGANASMYLVPRARLSDNGNYYVIVRKAGLPEPEFACTSSLAQVTVFCDDYPVQLLSAIGNVDQTTIELQFTHALDPAFAQNISNYTLSGGLTVAGVSQTGGRLTLTNSPQRQVGHNYTLTVRNLREDTDCANSLSPNPTVITFLTQDVRLLSFDAVWRYQNTGLDLGTAWKQPRYDDTTWPEGPGLLGFETTTATILALSNQNAFVGTSLIRTGHSGEAIITDYFRTRLNIFFDISGATFSIRHVIDDGALFYFNGAEVARYNMPTGIINAATLAPTAPGEGVIRSLTNLTGLVCGINSLAVEVHQQSPLSGDVLFGAELIGRFPHFAVASCGGHLAIRRNDDGTITIYWYAPTATLQETDDLGGQWRNLEDAVSPLSVPPGGASRFYRLR